MVSGNDKSPDAHETEAEIAVVLKIKIVIPGRPEARGAKPRAAVSIPSRTARVCPALLFPLFYLVEIRHRQLQSQSRTRSRSPMPGGYNANMAIA